LCINERRDSEELENDLAGKTIFNERKG